MPTFVASPEGRAPASAVLIYMDVFGPREELYEIARRYASRGYIAVLPHLFYRIGSPSFKPNNVRGQKLEPAAGAANNATTLAMVRRDTAAVFKCADGGGLGRAVRAWGVIGYCMGGRHAIAAAVEYPDRVRAGISVHGGCLVDTDESVDESPHLLVSRCRVPLHIACATNDPTCPPEHVEVLEAEASKTGGLVTVETLNAEHGWSFQDRWCYDQQAAEWIWEKSLRMFPNSHFVSATAKSD